MTKNAKTMSHNFPCIYVIHVFNQMKNLRNPLLVKLIRVQPKIVQNSGITPLFYYIYKYTCSGDILLF